MQHSDVSSLRDDISQNLFSQDHFDQILEKKTSFNTEQYILSRDQQLIEDRMIALKITELDSEVYRKNEYNCVKSHHNNPWTRNKLIDLLRGEADLLPNTKE